MLLKEPMAMFGALPYRTALQNIVQNILSDKNSINMFQESERLHFFYRLNVWSLSERVSLATKAVFIRSKTVILQCHCHVFFKFDVCIHSNTLSFAL